jgi:hypothetical protein
MSKVPLRLASLLRVTIVLACLAATLFSSASTGSVGSSSARSESKSTGELHPPAADSGCDPIRLRATRPAPGATGPFVLRLKVERVDALDDFDPSFIIDNEADFYPVITIDGNQKGGPGLKIDGYDHPEPTDDRWTFLQSVNVDPTAANGRDIPITVDIWDSDGGLTFDDDHGDVSPIVQQKTLSFRYNSCSLRVNPSQIFDDVLIGSAISDLKAHGNGDDDRARVQFRLDWVTSDGAAGVPSSNDLILTEADVIQVIPHATLVQGKPAVIKVKVQNTFATPVSPDININLRAPGVSVNSTSTITPALEPGEVRTLFCGASTCKTLTSAFNSSGDTENLPDPIMLPYTGSLYVLDLAVTLDPGGLFRPDDRNSCRAQNDFFHLGKQPVVPTRGHGQFRVAYAAVASTKVPNLPSLETVSNVRDLTSPFIRATWPLPQGSFNPDTFSLPIIIPSAASPGWEAVTDLILFFLQGGLNCADPFLTQIGLSVTAELAGQDRIVGVVTPDWFKDHSNSLCNWNSITGLSTIEMAPHGVLVVPEIIPVAAHELGHTFALSVEPSLKHWYSFDSFPIFSPGAWDEYNLPDPRGKPAEGIWLNQGVPEPSFIQALIKKRQCDSHCFMGNGSRASASDWVTQWSDRKRWIDGADYHRLVRALKVGPDPDVILVTGVITHKDRVAFAPWYTLPNRNVDIQLGSRGTYAFVFYDALDHVLGQAGFTPTHIVPEYGYDIGFTPFSLALPLPAKTARIDLVNRLSGRSLATRHFSPNRPSVKITNPISGSTIMRGQPLTLSWTGFDADKDPLIYTILESFDEGQSWNLLQLSTKDTSLLVPNKWFSAGSKLLFRVIATDGMYSAETTTGPMFVH